MTDLSTSTIDKPVLILVGPTAIGKTDLSLDLATQFDCEIVSVDSMQVYRYMDIGTAKVSRTQRNKVPHHLIDIVDPDEEYNAARFVSDCLEAITEIHQRGSFPLLTGGTGLYFKALTRGLFPAPATDPAIRENLRQRSTEEGSPALHGELKQVDPRSAARIHPNDTTRILRALEVYQTTGIPLSEHLQRHQSEPGRFSFRGLLSLGLTCDRETLYQRINLRSELLIKNGLEGEVRGLLDRGYGPELTSMQSIGYRHMVNYIEGRWKLQECKDLLARDTRRYAKRQYTWFGKDETIQWFDRGDTDELFLYVDRYLSKLSQGV